MGDHESAGAVAMLDDLGDELEELETRRRALRVTERGAHELDWLTLRREILAYGGIGCNADWTRDDIPRELFRVSGRPADLVAVEACTGAAWADDVEMMAHLWKSWRAYDASRRVERSSVVHRASRVAAVAPPARARGQRSFTELVAELKSKHGASVDLAGLRAEWVHAYETGERVTVSVNGREYRGTIGATRGPLPRFVLLTSLPL